MNNWWRGIEQRSYLKVTTLSLYGPMMKADDIEEILNNRIDNEKKNMSTELIKSSYFKKNLRKIL